MGTGFITMMQGAASDVCIEILEKVGLEKLAVIRPHVTGYSVFHRF